MTCGVDMNVKGDCQLSRLTCNQLGRYLMDGVAMSRAHEVVDPLTVICIFKGPCRTWIFYFSENLHKSTQFSPTSIC